MMLDRIAELMRMYGVSEIKFTRNNLLNTLDVYVSDGKHNSLISHSLKDCYADCPTYLDALLTDQLVCVSRASGRGESNL